MKKHALALLGVVILVIAGAAALLTAPEAKATVEDTRQRVEVVGDPQMWAGLDQALEGWNASTYVRLVRVETCSGDVYCVRVEAADYGNVDWCGLTSYEVDGEALVQANWNCRKWYGTLETQGAVWSHELGHALGLEHHAETYPSTMTEYDLATTTPWASEDDLSDLERAWVGGTTFGALAY